MATPTRQRSGGRRTSIARRLVRVLAFLATHVLITLVLEHLLHLALPGSAC